MVFERIPNYESDNVVVLDKSGFLSRNACGVRLGDGRFQRSVHAVATHTRLRQEKHVERSHIACPTRGTG